MALPEAPPSRPQTIGILGPGSLTDLNNVHDFEASSKKGHQEKKSVAEPGVDASLLAAAQALLASKSKT